MRVQEERLAVEVVEIDPGSVDSHAEVPVGQEEGRPRLQVAKTADFRFEAVHEKLSYYLNLPYHGPGVRPAVHLSG